MRSVYEKDKPFAVLVGLDSMQGIQTARILARHRIPVIALAKDPDHHCCRTRVCEEVIYTNTGNEDLLSVLNELGPRLASKAVLFPCHDLCVALIARHRESLGEWYHTVLPDTDVVETLMGKHSFYEFAGANNFTVPATFTLSGRNDVATAAGKLEFPAVLKPEIRSKVWDSHTEAKAFRVESADELLKLYAHVQGWADSLVVQQWIDGDESRLYSFNCYFDRRGELAGGFVARKIRQWPPYTGSSCMGEEYRDDLFREEATRLFETVGYRGLGYVEAKHDSRSGRHYFIEANVGRPTGRSAIAEAGGVELLYAMYCDALDLPVSVEPQQYLGVKWVDLRHDAQSAFHYWRRGELTLRGWWDSWRGPKAHTLLSWSDPGPFLWDIYRCVRIALSPRERRKRRLPVVDQSRSPAAVDAKQGGVRSS